MNRCEPMFDGCTSKYFLICMLTSNIVHDYNVFAISKGNYLCFFVESKFVILSIINT